jgi:hypothetical protein
MQSSDKAAFKELLTAALSFYRQDVTPFSLDVWWCACERFELEQVRKALTAHAMDTERGQFAPKPADVIRVLQGTHTDRALMAWGKVYEAMSAVGAYQSVVFDDPAIHSAIEDMGGWPEMCRGKIEALSFTQRRFCETYRAYALRPGHAYPPRLVGVFEAENRLKGYAVRPPALVGDPERCAAVQSGGSDTTRVQITHAASVIPQLEGRFA